MKLIILLALTLTSQLFAQDSYHSFEQTACLENESCLVTQADIVIKFLPIENRRGEIVGEKLSTYASLDDVMYEGSHLCYAGKAQDACRMLDLMSGGQSGHTSITMFHCKINNGVINTGYRIEFEMGHQTYYPEFEIKKCE